MRGKNGKANGQLTFRCCQLIAIRYSTNENTHTYMYVLHNKYAACVITRRTVFEYAVNFITYYKVKHLI